MGKCAGCCLNPESFKGETAIEDDTCSYPRCDKLAPQPWWPFCYQHSPDSGLSPGALLYCYNKLQHVTDNKQTRDLDSKEPAVDRTSLEYQYTQQSSHSDSEVKAIEECQTCVSESDDETGDEEDICSYPRCESLAPEVTWPFCYQHSPDSGLSPGALLYCWNEFAQDTSQSITQPLISVA